MLLILIACNKFFQKWFHEDKFSKFNTQIEHLMKEKNRDLIHSFIECALFFWTKFLNQFLQFCELGLEAAISKISNCYQTATTTVLFNFKGVFLRSIFFKLLILHSNDARELVDGFFKRKFFERGINFCIVWY